MQQDVQKPLTAEHIKQNKDDFLPNYAKVFFRFYGHLTIDKSQSHIYRIVGKS